MLAIPFDGSRPIAKPGSMTDEECSSLEILQGFTSLEKWPFTLSLWKPSREDLEALNRGDGIWVRVLSHTVHPISLFTTNAEGEINQ